MRGRFTTAVLAAVGVLASTCGQAFAGEPESVGPTQLQTPAPPAPTLSGEPLRLREETRTYYGWQNLLVMGGSLVLAAALGAAGSPASFIVGLGGFYLGPPIVHWAHGNVGKGFASLGVGVGGALVLGAAATVVLTLTDDKRGERCNDLCGMELVAGLAIGVLVGAIPYLFIDQAYLAWDNQSGPDPSIKPDTSSIRIIPKLWLAQNQATFGFSGEF